MRSHTEVPPNEEMSATIAIVEAAQALLDKLGRDNLLDFIEQGRPARTFEYLIRSLV